MEHNISPILHETSTKMTTRSTTEHVEDEQQHSSENDSEVENDGPVFHSDDDDSDCGNGNDRVGDETKDTEIDTIAQMLQQQMQLQDKKEEKSLHIQTSNKYMDEELVRSSLPILPQAPLSTAGTRPLPQSHPKTTHSGQAPEYSFTYTEASVRPRRVYKRPNPQRYHTCNPALLYSRLSTMKAEAEVRRSHSRGNTPLVNAEDDSDDDLDIDELDEAALLRRLSTEKARKASREAQKYLSGGATMTHADVLMMFRMMQNDFPIPSPTIHGVNNSAKKS